MLKENKNLYVRKAISTDNVADIAKYIHQTDPFLYDKPDDLEWVATISENLSTTNSIFFKDNIFVAIDDNKIIGLMNIIPCGVKYVFPNKKDTRNQAYEQYFLPLIDEMESLDGYYLCNICVDENYRNQGIGHLLMNYLLIVCKGTIHTDAVADNFIAIKLYKDSGFVVTEEYVGYSGKHSDGIKCVKLAKPFFCSENVI